MIAWLSAVGRTALLVGVLSGCGNDLANGRDGATPRGETGTDTDGWDAARWRPPAIAELPNDSLGAAVRRGFALITATHDSLRGIVQANLNCTSCHLDEGRRATASPLGGVYARYPRYIER